MNDIANIVKKVSLCFTLLIASASCDDYNHWFEDAIPSLKEHRLGISETYFELHPEASYTGFYISGQTPWQFTEVPSWISISPMYGAMESDATLTYEANPSAEKSRTAIFSLVSTDVEWDCEIPITATQSKATPFVEVETIDLTFDGTGGSQMVEISANVGWEAYTYYDDWVTLDSIDNHTLKVTLPENTSGKSRTATVYIKKWGASSYLGEDQFKVTQHAPNVTVAEETLNFEQMGGARTVSVQSEAAWTAYASKEWIEVEPTNGVAGNSNLKITVLPNTSTSSRTGYVYVEVGSKSVAMTITQGAPTLTVSPASLDFTAESSKQKFFVSSNVAWSVTSLPDWVTLSKKEGSKNDEIEVTVTENTSVANTRQGDIVISYKDNSNLKKSVRITQAGKLFSPAENTLNFSAKNSTQSLKIEASGAWTAKSNNDWITVSPASATGTATLSVSVSENNAAVERSGTITLASGDKTTTITVNQASKYFRVNSPNLSFTSKGGKHAITIATDAGWSASVQEGCSWLSLSQTSGTEDCNLDVTATDNPSADSRTAEVTIKSNISDKVYVITFVQQGRYITVNSEKVAFFKRGGSKDVTVNTDGTFTTNVLQTWSGEVMWLKCTVQSNVVTISADAYESDSQRTGTVRISLTGLSSGTKYVDVTVTQYGNSNTILVDEFGDDVNHDGDANLDVKITLDGYGEDSNFDYL